MPAFEEEEIVEQTEPAVTEEEAPVLETDFQDNVINNELVEIASLLANSEGFDWTTDYYSQVLGADQAPMGQDLSGDIVLQQYTKIAGLEIKVSAPLSSEYNEDNGETTLTGTATLYAGVRPQVGDMFVAQIGDGRKGVLELTSHRRLTHLNGSAYEINYVVVDFATDERLDNLAAKVVKDLTFDKARLGGASKGVLTTTQVATTRNVSEVISLLTDEYLNKMYSDRLESLLEPQDKLYDPHVARFCIDLFPTTLLGVHIREIILSFEKLPYTTIYDWVLSGRATPHTGATLMREAERTEFNDTPELNGIRYTHVEKVMFPSGFPTDADWDNAVDVPTEAVEQAPTDPLPVILPVDDDDNYVLSYNYYNGLPCRSMLEVELRSFLNGDSVNIVNIMKIVDDRNSGWSSRDYFYYVPLLLALLRTFDKEF